MEPKPWTEDAEQGPLRPGQIFRSNYEIRGLIGRGGHAWVYHACHRFMGHHVALKILRSDGGSDRDHLRRGLAEAQIQHKLQHPGIVPVGDAGFTEDGHLYIVMDLLHGRSLRELLQEFGRLEIEEVLRLATQIADAMQVAHEAGIIHRDLKPENVFVVAGNKIKVIDFGVAKVLGKSGWSTHKDMVLGTIYYMSPEQLQASPLTPRSDIYALGVMMYEALMGQHPVLMLLGAGQRTFYALSHIIVRQRPPMLDMVDPRIPRDVAALVNQAVAKVPQQRFSSMKELADALRECLQRYESRAARKRRVTLQTRDLSIKTKGSSGVEPATRRTAWPEADPLLGPLGEGDTRPESRPLFFGAISSGALLGDHGSRENVANVVELHAASGLGTQRKRVPAEPSHAENSANRDARGEPASSSSGQPESVRRPSPERADATRVRAVAKILGLGGLVGFIAVGAAALATSHGPPKVEGRAPQASSPTASSVPTVQAARPPTLEVPTVAAPTPATPSSSETVVANPSPVTRPKPGTPRVRPAASRPAPAVAQSKPQQSEDLAIPGSGLDGALDQREPAVKPKQSVFESPLRPPYVSPATSGPSAKAVKP